jgi:hypothetical protein
MDFTSKLVTCLLVTRASLIRYCNDGTQRGKVTDGRAPRAGGVITIVRGRIVEIGLVADPERLRQLDLVILNE